MPYLRITCPEMPDQRRRAIAEQLTKAVNDVFYNPRARFTREELRERTTVHFTVYRGNELFIGFNGLLSDMVPLIGRLMKRFAST